MPGDSPVGPITAGFTGPTGEKQMEPLIVLGACCVPLAAGAIGLVWWGNREEKADVGSRGKTLPVENLSLGQRLSLILRRRSGEAR